MKTPKGYKLIPMSEITGEARMIAIAWMECDDKDWIGQKHKLASDIMNYAKKHHEAKLKEGPEPEITDADYLFECIEKAKPNLSKITDVDQEMAEIRGIETITDADIETSAQRYVKKLPQGVNYQRYIGYIYGAKAMRDNEIKHIK
jgi:hypothetical protein